jgi:AcrR family transcriptional regulator
MVQIDLKSEGVGMDQGPRSSGGRTTADIRLAIQQSQESIRTLAERYGVNPKTVAKWRARASVEDRKTGPQNPKSTVLSPEQEAIIVAFRRFSRLPLDDCFYVLGGYIPGLTRSSLHRCLRRHGISRLEPGEDEALPAGWFDLHVIDPAPGPGGHHLFLAVDRASKFAFAELLPTATLSTAAGFLRALIAFAPIKVTAVITEPGQPFSAVVPGKPDPFSRACLVAGVEHRPTQPGWSADQLERMDRTIRDATRRRVSGGREDELRRQLAQVIEAYNGGVRFKALGGLTPLAHLRRMPDEALKSLRRPARAAQTQPVDGAARRARDPDGTREAILQAARSCLAQDGPEGLSLSEVARVAGVNRGTAYQHFETREKLINATAEWVSDKLFRAVFGDPQHERPLENVDVAGITDRLANYAMDNPELCRAWLLQVLSSPEPASDLFWREYAGSQARFSQTELAQEHLDAEVLSVIMLAGAFLWPVWARAQSTRTDDLRRFARRFADECLRVSMYGNLRAERYPDIAERLKREAANAA